MFIEDGLDLIRQQPNLRVVYSTSAAPTEIPSSTYAVPAAKTDPSNNDLLSSTTQTLMHAGLKAQILAHVEQIVANAPGPVMMSKIASQVHKAFDTQIRETKWAGEGTFKALLQRDLTLSQRIAISTVPPGYVYDPRRHTPPSLDSRESQNGQERAVGR